MNNNMFKKLIIDALQMGFLLVGPFLLGSGCVLIGIGVYLWVEEPNRLVGTLISEKRVAPVKPQPSRVLPGDKKLLIIEPDVAAYLTGAASVAPTWVNGKAFASGWRAQWEVLRTAWRLWLLCIGTLICGVFLKRFFLPGLPRATGIR